ncbi:MAG TPA: hypothetical protein VN944_00480 [Nitrospiria bacterium]|nr:hypothetical protein [Nitrospiria bacterium]
MVRQCFAVLFLLGTLSSPPASWAETRVEQNIEARITVALRVPQAEAQKFIPAPWLVNPLSSGPSKEANLLLTFRDRALNLDGEGVPVAGGAERGAIIIIPAKHAETGETAMYVVRVFTSKPQSLPGDYKNAALAEVRHEQSFKASDSDFGVGTDLWEVRDKSGGVIDFSLQYQKEAPVQTKPESKTHGGPNPTFFRIYRVDQGLDVVKSIPAGIDRVKNNKFHVTMKEFSGLFDGTEQLVSITVIPWYIRQVFIP